MNEAAGHNPVYHPVINDGAKTAARGNPVNRVKCSTNDAPRRQANTAIGVTVASDRCWHLTIEGGNFNSTQILARIVSNQIEACPPVQLLAATRGPIISRVNRVFRRYVPGRCPIIRQVPDDRAGGGLSIRWPNSDCGRVVRPIPLPRA